MGLGEMEDWVSVIYKVSWASGWSDELDGDVIHYAEDVWGGVQAELWKPRTKE